MTTFSGPIKQKAAYGDPTSNTFTVDSSGTITTTGGFVLGGKATFARKIVAASVSAASSAANFTLVPRGYIEVYVSGTRCGIPYFTEKS